MASPAATALKKVVLIGASGTIGSIILAGLLEEKDLEIAVLTRGSSTASFPKTVKVIQTSYAEAELVEAFQGQDVVISAIGAMGFQDQKAIVDAAVKASVQRFLPSEFSANTLSETVRALVPVFPPKKDVLEYLKEKESTGLTWTGLATGPVLDWGLQVGFLGFDLAQRKAILWDGGYTPFSATNSKDLGKAVVGVLRHPSKTANQYLYVSTATTTQATILKALEAHSHQSWEVENVETDLQVTKGRQALSEGDVSGMFELVKASFWGKVEGARANYAAEEKLATSTLGLSDEVDGVLEANVQRVLQTV